MSSGRKQRKERWEVRHFSKRQKPNGKTSSILQVFKVSPSITTSFSEVIKMISHNTNPCSANDDFLHYYGP